MAVTMAEISKLRHLTGAGLMDCKKALAEANNDMEAAIEIIRKKGQAVAAKREDREAAEGCVLSASNGKFAAIVALKCETDFVAKNEGFVNLTKSILAAVMEKEAKSIDDVKALEINGKSVADLIVEEIGKTGEKMELGAYEYIEAPSTIAYNHFGNKLASIVGFNEEGKPEAIIDRIAQGRLNKFYKENVLMEQEFVSDNSMDIATYLSKQSAGLKAIAFRRVNLNED